MTTKFQCDHCLHILGLPGHLTGRKILCPMCGNALVIPKADPKRTFQKQNLRESLPKFQLSDWDRAIAEAVLDDGRLKDKQLLKALIELIKKNKKGPETSLSEVLVQQKLLSTEEQSAYRSRLRGNVDAAETTFVECPNCFANVDSKLPSCNFCGQQLGASAETAICPNCKNEQPRELERCRRCMADMKTGLRPTKQRCNKCGELVLGAVEVCPSCKAPFAKPPRRGGRSRALPAWWWKGALAAGVLVLVVLVWQYPTLRYCCRVLTVGAAQASLENRAEQLGTVLMERDRDHLEAYLHPEGEFKNDAVTWGRVLLGPEFQGKVRRIKEIQYVATRLSGEEPLRGRLRLRVDAVVQDKNAITAGDGMDDVALRLGGGGKPKSFDVTWLWEQYDGRWYYREARRREKE